MKKTISINIAGLIFYIEEDGYDKLKNYLNSIQKYFSSYEDSKEIISDIESRIAEKFLTKQKSAEQQVIALDDVEQLIKSMGTVADFEAIEEEEDLADSKETVETAGEPKRAKTVNETLSTPFTPKKLVRDTKRKLIGGVCAGIAHYFNTDPLLVRLVFLFFFLGLPVGGGIIGDGAEDIFGPISGFIFIVYIACWVAFPGSTTLEEDVNLKKFYRDPDKKVVGGVAAGVAAYFGIDLGVVRFAWVLSILLFGSGLLLYIVLWLITPRANTLTEKMEMTGQPITLENIETNVKKALQPEQQKEESVLTKLLLLPFRAIAAIFNGLTPLMRFLVVVMRLFAGFILVMLGASALIGLITALFTVLGLGSWDFGSIDSDFMPLNFFLGEVTPLAYVFLFLAIGAPFAIIAWLGVSLLTKENKFTPSIWQTLLGLFLVGIIGTTVYGVRYGSNFRRNGSVEKVQNYKLSASPILLELSDSVDGDSYNNTHLDLDGYEGTDAKLELEFRSQGRSRQDAEFNASNIIYNVKQSDSSLVFDEDFSLSDKASRFRGQNVRMQLYMPYNKTFKMTRDFYDHFWGVRQRSQYEYDLEVNDEKFKTLQWTIKADSGLVCLNRAIVMEEHDGSYGDSDSHIDEISGGIESGLNEAFDKSFEGRGELVKQFDLRSFDKVRVGGAFVVRIQQGDGFKVVADGREEDLDEIEAKVEDGVLKIQSRKRIKLFENSKRIGITITMPKLKSVDLSGATLTKITGFSNSGDLKVEISGASKTFIDVNLQELKLDVSGASKVELHGKVNTLEADLSGACMLDAEQMQIQNANVDASGVSKANLGSIPNLQSSASGASRIHRQGE